MYKSWFRIRRVLRSLAGHRAPEGDWGTKQRPACCLYKFLRQGQQERPCPAGIDCVISKRKYYLGGDGSITMLAGNSLCPLICLDKAVESET